MRFMLVLLLLLALPDPLFAADGELEISQAAALNTGCFPGDTPGFPVTISEPGSYILTGALDVPDGASSAIEIQASNVDLNLRGFTIRNTGTGAPGVVAQPTATSVSIRNGRLNPAGALAIELPEDARIENLNVRSGSVRCGDRCSIAELTVREASTGSLEAVRCVNDCTIVDAWISSSNSGTGTLECGDRCTIQRTRVFANPSGLGIKAGVTAQISNSHIEGKIEAVGGLSVLESYISGRLGASIATGANSLIQASFISEALTVGDDSSILDSIFPDSSSANPAITVTDGTARLAGSIFRNPTPIFSGTLIDAGGNVCNGTLGCP